jgi:predicted acylesterase/phospholipase RssA
LERALPAYLRDVHVRPTELRPPPSAAQAEQFYGDDCHITAAVLQLHPLLGTDAASELLGSLTWRDWPAGTTLAELSDDPEPSIHLLIVGRARLVATFGDGPDARQVLGQYRCGQWIGFPELLRTFDRDARPRNAWPEDAVRLEVECLEPMRTQSIPMAVAQRLMRESPDFLRFVEHQVAVRFARRRTMLKLVRENPILRLLDSGGREYFLQLGALVRVDQDRPYTYLQAGRAAGRTALVLDGEGTLLVPRDDGSGMRFTATLRAGDLVGHEGLVMRDEWDEESASAVPIVEPPRHTSVRLAPATQVFEIPWYALRWLLDDRAAVWVRVKQILSGATTAEAEEMPRIVVFHAARAGLGTTTLAYGTAAALATTCEDTIAVLDLYGEDNFVRWKQYGFTAMERDADLQSAPRRLRAEGRPTRATFTALTPPAGFPWPKNLRVVWPAKGTDANVLEQLIDAIQLDEGVSHIVISGGDDALDAMLARLEGRCDAVFHVCDDADTNYPGAEPEHLTWVYRMTPAYRAGERRRAGRGHLDWMLAGTRPAFLRAAVERVLGRDFDAALARETMLGARRVVRVPDDPDGARVCDRAGFCELVGPDAPDLALTRAFARLARVVDQCTVGLALGGGGAWGFSHVALLRNLEATGVPIDYIAGTSFGSVVGALYAAGGMRALDALVDGNSASGPGLVATLTAITTGRLNRALFAAPFSSVAVERFIHGELRAHGDPACLGVTEIPFAPVGTNLGTHGPLMLPHATAGRGVRMSGSLPPMFASMLRRLDRIADGAFVANVPSRVVRDMGAHFVIAANVVPPPPEPAPSSLGWSLATYVPRMLIERLEDTVRGVFVLAWKAGQDQSALAADHALELLPRSHNLFEMWRGRDIVAEIQARHFADKKDERRIRDAWDDFRGARSATSGEASGGATPSTVSRVRPAATGSSA